MKHASITLALALAVAAAVLASNRMSAQSGAPTMNFDAVNPLTLPDDIYFGEIGGVATNSRGEIHRWRAALRRHPVRCQDHSGDRQRKRERYRCVLHDALPPHVSTSLNVTLSLSKGQRPALGLAGDGCSTYFCTRHDSISPRTTSFGLRQSSM